MHYFLDFEKPIAALEGKIEELRHLGGDSGLNIADEIGKLQSRIDKELSQTYKKLGPWEKVQVARHPKRPKVVQIIAHMFTDFTPLSGDRNYAEDYAIIGGLARFQGQPVVVMGTEKGSTTEQRVKRNFGMPQPEGYRKAKRLMQLAERFNLPVITFIDTAGAYPGIEGEERGQSEAIATNLAVMSKLRTPIIVIITGEGGSGGALAIGVGDHIAILEHATYSVASPEACASIIWRTAEKASDAAEAMKVSAQELIKIKIVDEIIKEPLGGAHRDYKEISESVRSCILKNLGTLLSKPIDDLLQARYKKLLEIG